MAEGFYNTDGLDAERFLILSDMQQTVPAGRLKVVDRNIRKSAEGKEFPTLLLEDTDGNKYTVAAWKRDCRLCLQQWGGEPINWGFVSIVKGATRYYLAPSPDQAVTEEAV